MTGKTTIRILTGAAACAGLLTGCASDEPTLNRADISGATLMATIGGSEAYVEPGTRASTAVINDLWSYVRFNSITDTIGFYSVQGNLRAPDGNGPFTNEPMVYMGSTYEGNGNTDDKWYGLFKGIDMDYELGLIMGEGAKTFVYFPYAVGMDSKGLMLRRRASDGRIRCVDALSIKAITVNNNTLMTGKFVHGFAELMILRGTGFDKPPKGCEEIKVVLNKGYSHVTVVDNPHLSETHPDWKVLMPIYNADCGMTEEECREWVAWRGADYKATETSDPRPAYYVIVPTALSGSRSTVDYIELYDNLGTLHRITSFYLYTQNDKRVDVSARYPLEIMMDNLVPTVYPYRILPWDDVTSVTDERNCGIEQPTDFSDFIMAYNHYIETNRADEGKLAQYGDRWETDGKVGWHFYINNDIDMTKIPESSYRIPLLCDTIDGLRNTLSGLRIESTAGTSGFVGTLQEGGCIRNLNVEGLYVTNTTDTPAGGLVEEMTGGLIANCGVDGYVYSPNSSVGMAAAKMTGGTIVSSNFSGLLVGKTTYNRLFGEQPSPEAVWASGNGYSGIIFTQGD